METVAEQKGLYLIDNYQGTAKWCFAIILNRACDNYTDNPCLFSESLLRFEEVRRKDWFDEETRKLIYDAEKILPPDPQKRYELKPKNLANERLNRVRNYFSHFHHQDRRLYFEKDDPIRIIMIKAYEKAKENVIGHQKKETDIKFPDLFESNGRITSAGVVFLASIFVERRILARLMGYVKGFKHTEGEYNITRDIFFTYCLKDSYSIHTPDPKAVLFRDILGYLSRVPSEYYKYNKEQCDKENDPEREIDKFISFALEYLEEFVLNGIANYTVTIARMEVIREETTKTKEKDEQHKPNPNQGKVKIVFDSTKRELPYYINHNTVIMQIQKKGGILHSCKLGINDLKYLVLLCLQGKATQAIAAIDDYINKIQERFADPKDKIGSDEEQLIQGLPEFIRIYSGLEPQDAEKDKNNRLDYIRKKWDKKKTESIEAELHRKGRDILRYINWHCERALASDKYNELLALLVNKDFAGFGVQLNELKRTERIPIEVFETLKGFENINKLHERVCNLVLKELAYLEQNDPEKLAEYIGLVPNKTDKEPPSYEAKVKAFIEQPMIYKGFFRDSFFKQAAGKTFAKWVEETLNQLKQPDVPLKKEGKDYYHIPALDRFHKDNSVLYETLAQDRLCVMMARECYKNINENLQKKGQKFEWKDENGKEFLYLKIDRFTIRFDRKHYTKLYVMDDAEFLGKLMAYYFTKEQTLDYYKLYSDGMNHYTELQKQGITAILAMEEKIIRGKKIPTSQEYIGFKIILSNINYLENETKSLGRVRNALLHYNLNFSINDFRTFSRILKTEGFVKDWNIKV